MSELFSDGWIKSFQETWNNDSALIGELGNVNFNSVIGYGFPDSDNPECVIEVIKGKIVSAGPYNNEELNWDLRCTKSTWENWMAKPPGMIKLGLAYTSGKLKFAAGDYGVMIKDPVLAGSFIKSFSVMAKVT